MSLTEEPGAPRTRRPGVRERLHDSDELYRLLAEHSTDMISKHTPEGVYTYASFACRSLLGYDPEDLIGRDAYEFFHPDDVAEVSRTHSAILEHPDTHTVDYRIRRKDGSYTWFETTSRTVRNPETDEVLEIIAISRDVTERKRTEEELRESEERFRAFFETAAVGAAHADPATGRFLQVNEKLCRFLGYDEEELLCMTFSDIAHPDDRAQDLEGLSRLLRGEIREYAAEKRYVRMNGQTVWGQLAISLVRDANGRALHTVAITRDITERKRLEEAMFEIREAERRRIARDLHDVVLQDLAGALQGMQAAQVESAGSGLEQEIAALRRAVGSLRNAIYDLRLEKEQPFVRAVESLVELNRQLTPEREILLTVCDGFPSELPGTADVELLRVLQEALVNARRHSDAQRVEVVLSTGHREVQAEVADDGVGFDPALVREGLGLAGMRERVSALGGRLEIVSTPDQRTSVKVEVPFPRSP